MADKTRSDWWYLLPLIFGIIGGLIGFFAIRKDDPKKAKRILIVGIIMQVINTSWEFYSIGFLTHIGFIAPPLSYLS